MANYKSNDSDQVEMFKLLFEMVADLKEDIASLRKDVSGRFSGPSISLYKRGKKIPLSESTDEKSFIDKLKNNDVPLFDVDPKRDFTN